MSSCSNKEDPPRPREAVSEMDTLFRKMDFTAARDGLDQILQQKITARIASGTSAATGNPPETEERDLTDKELSELAAAGTGSVSVKMRKH